MTTGKINNLGQILRQRRVMMQMTLQKMSDAAGVSPSHLIRIERGERFPSARILRKLAKPLGATEIELFGLAGYLSPEPLVVGESQTSMWQLDPYVAAVLSQESFEVQRLLVSMLAVVKSIGMSLRRMERT